MFKSQFCIVQGISIFCFQSLRFSRNFDFFQIFTFLRNFDFLRFSIYQISKFNFFHFSDFFSTFEIFEGHFSNSDPSLVMPPKPEESKKEDEMSYNAQLRRMGKLPEKKEENSMQKKYERRIRLRKIRESVTSGPGSAADASG